MPGRFFDIQANPSAVTIPPGGTGTVPYTVTNLIGRAVTAEFVIAAPDEARKSWATVSNGAVRQFVLGGKQDFTVTITVPANAPEDPPGRSSQFGVFVKDQADPEHVFDPGPPFTVTVKGPPVTPTPGPTPPRKWIIPVAIGAGVLIVAAIAWLFWPKHAKPLPNVVGLQYRAAADTLKAYDYRDTVVATEFAAGKAEGVVLRQTPGDTAAAAKDTAFAKSRLVQLTLAAKGVALPNLRSLPDTVALDTLQKLTLLIGKVTPQVTSNQAQNARVINQAPDSGLVPQGTRVDLVLGLYQPPSQPPVDCRKLPWCLKYNSDVVVKVNRGVMDRIKTGSGPQE